MGYLSSEARGSIPLSDEGSKGVLTVATNFFEFVAVTDVESNPDEPASWPFLTVADLAMDREYYIFFTTQAQADADDNPTSRQFWVRDAGKVLKGNVGHYLFISTISVYAAR